MTVDEALEIVETVLDYDRLNKVQEIVFRQSWEGRSYMEIAKIAGYEPDYIKDAGAKLWKLLSKALGEKVKKDNLQSVLKRYLGRNKVNLQRNLVIEVNLSGANLSGANLSGARVVANFIETDLSHADSQGLIIPDDNTKSDEEIVQDEEEDNQEVQSNSEEGSLYWNGWYFRSDAEVQIAEALDRAGVLFFPKSKARLTTPEGRQKQEPDFLICYEGKLGILEVGHEEAVQSEERDIYQSSGIRIVQHYDATRCREQPDIIVQEFLDILRQA